MVISLQFSLLAQMLVVSIKADALTSRLFSAWAGQAPGRRKADLNPGHRRMETIFCVQGVPHTPSAVTEEAPAHSESSLPPANVTWQLQPNWVGTGAELPQKFITFSCGRKIQPPRELPLPSSLPAQPRPPPPATPACPAPLGNSRND